MAELKHLRNVRMKGVRISNGNLSQKQAAARLGYTTQYYSRVERGMIDGCVDFWRRFQIVFELSDSEIWAVINNRAPEKPPVIC